MPIDFRQTELNIKCKEETTYTMSIKHKGTGIVVADHGDHKYALECSLLNKLREKIEEKENATRDSGD